MLQRTLSVLGDLVASIAGLMFPQHCIFCGEMAETLVCDECAGKLTPVQHPICPRCGKPLKTGVARSECLHCSGHPWHVDTARALFIYEGQGRDALHRFKYGRRRGLARFFGRELSRGAGDLNRLGALFNWDFGEEPEMVIPMPLHWWKRFLRWFNQSELILKFYAPTLDLPVEPLVLKRTRFTRSQVGLTEPQRFANVRRAFVVPERAAGRVRGKRILLLDDLVTTGATLNAAARALKGAGAKKVYALSFFTAVLK
ncbi:ComF family protein [bacterium]|nr:ComF family protein [bacterium]